MTTDINSRDILGQTQLKIAARYGNDAEVARLLALKADVDLANDNGLVAPHRAVQIHNERLIDRLIIFSQSITPLRNAAFRGHEQIARSLIDAKANVNTRGNDGLVSMM